MIWDLCSSLNDSLVSLMNFKEEFPRPDKMGQRKKCDLSTEFTLHSLAECLIGCLKNHAEVYVHGYGREHDMNCEY